MSLLSAETNFDTIRCLTDAECREVIGQLTAAGVIEKILPVIDPDYPVSQLKSQLRQIESIASFQEKIIYPFVQHLLKISGSSFTYSGMENLEPGKNHLFISNHRDIIFDPVLLNVALFENGTDTAEVAIGDNLLKFKWVEDLVRLNKSFIVRRNLSSRELVLASRHLSAYIRSTMLEKGHSVWIAQRQGRAKDGDDQTQPGLLNMLLMAAGSHHQEYLSKLNIVPVSISYQYDPCDTDKVKELYAKTHAGTYVKTENEDQDSMKKGIFGKKGQIYLHFGRPVNDTLTRLPSGLHKNELTGALCEIIDQHIIANYRLFESNYLAYDLYFGGDQFAAYYTDTAKEAFAKTTKSRLDAAGLHTDDHLAIYYKMYAQPLINKLRLSEEG